MVHWCALCCLYLLNNSSLKMKNDFWCISWILISFVTLFSYMFLTFWLMFSVLLKFLKAFLDVSIIHLFPKCCSLPEILCFFYFPWDMAEKASSSTNFALSAQLFSSFPFLTFYGNIYLREIFFLKASTVCCKFLHRLLV